MMFFSHIKEKCRTSLWFLPGIFGALAILFAVGLLYLEKTFAQTLSITWMQNLEGRTLTITLSTLLGAIVTVFGILLPMTFSILMRASNQFTPIVLRVYREDTAPKLFLSCIFATTLYLLTMLIALNYFFLPSIPNISIFIAFIFIVATVYSIPAFLDRFTASLEPTYLVDLITQDLLAILNKFEKWDAGNKDNRLEAKQDRSQLNRELYQYSVHAQKSGYIQSIDSQTITRIFHEKNAVGAVPTRTGNFIFEGNPICFFNFETEPDQEMITRIQNCFHFGEKRVGISDLELQLDELLSIVVRALSPGVTDLSTALSCINHVGSACNLILNRKLPQGIFKDEEEQIRLYTKEFDFYGFVHSAFDTMRQNANLQPAVIIQILKVIQLLINNCISRERAEILRDIARLVVDEVKDHHQKFDREKICHYLDLIESDLCKIS